MKGGIIYCYINKINFKCYVGQTASPYKRKRQHIIDSKNPKSNYFHRAIKKYGIDNFEYIVLKTICVSNSNNYRLTMDKLESEYIVEFNSFHNGYNRTEGGGGV